MTRLALLVATAALALSVTNTSRADDPEKERRAKVVLKIGTHAVTVAELEDRLAEIPPVQLQTFGASKEAIVKAYLEQVLIRDVLLQQGAETKKLEDTPPTKHQVQRARSAATLRQVRAVYKSAAAVPIEDVTKYYEDNRSRFDSPERINLWRILTKTKDEAESVLATAKKELTIPKWNDLARDKSIDKATYFRGGNLGFVGPDGASNEAGVKVDPVLVKAVASVKDGELLSTVTPEGSNFAVIWRRSTVPATKRSLEDATAQIRTTLFHQRTEEAERALVDDLKKKNVTNYDAEPLKIIEFPAIDAGLGLPRSIPSAR